MTVHAVDDIRLIWVSPYSRHAVTLNSGDVPSVISAAGMAIDAPVRAKNPGAHVLLNTTQLTPAGTV